MAMMFVFARAFALTCAFVLFADFCFCALFLVVLVVAVVVSIIDSIGDLRRC